MKHLSINPSQKIVIFLFVNLISFIFLSCSLIFFPNWLGIFEWFLWEMSVFFGILLLFFLQFFINRKRKLIHLSYIGYIQQSFPYLIFISIALITTSLDYGNFIDNKIIKLASLLVLIYSFYLLTFDIWNILYAQFLKYRHKKLLWLRRILLLFYFFISLVLVVFFQHYLMIGFFMESGIRSTKIDTNNLHLNGYKIYELYGDCSPLEACTDIFAKKGLILKKINKRDDLSYLITRIDNTTEAYNYISLVRTLSFPPYSPSRIIEKDIQQIGGLYVFERIIIIRDYTGHPYGIDKKFLSHETITSTGDYYLSYKVFLGEGESLLPVIY